MSETQNNTVVAAFLTATGNAGLTKTKRVEIGGSSAEIDFGKVLKAATQVNDFKERNCQAEKPDYREPGRTSTAPELKVKTNNAPADSKPVVNQGTQGNENEKEPEELKTPALDHGVKANDSNDASPTPTRAMDTELGTQVQDSEENQLPDEIQTELVSLMNQLTQLLAILNPQVNQNNGANDSNGLSGVDAANLQSLLNQLQMMLNPQKGTAAPQASNGANVMAGLNQTNGVTANQSSINAASDLLNQITALMQDKSFNDSPSFQQLLGETAASLKNLVAQGSNTQTAETANVTAFQTDTELVRGAATVKSPGSSKPVILEIDPSKNDAVAAADSSKPQTELQVQSQTAGAQLAKGAFNEGKPLNLALIQTQLTVGENQDQSGTNVAIAPLQNQNSSLVSQTQQPASQETAPVNRDQLFSQIVERAKFMFANNHSEMEVNLKPDHLGKLQLKVVVENQVVTARFVAESQQVKEIIETNLNQLRDQLRQNGIQVDSLTVAVGNQMNPQNFNQTGNGQNGTNNFGAQFQGFNAFNENKEEESAPTPQSIRDTVIDLIA